MATHTETEHIKRPTNQVAAALMILMILEVLLGLVFGPRYLENAIALKQFVYVLLIIALLAKAFLVVWYYMGLKYEEYRREIAVFVIIIPLLFVFLFILLPVVGLTSGTPR